ncbi:carboxymuconolactone decarboxylase family protein [Gottfriedia acidiceleris]|uniref:carboxymuconolactone decarboxylase family protein n=1 Tax=Gottfriedia acidiceleris TaxID=371036 RepID=UPI002F264A8B
MEKKLILNTENKNQKVILGKKGFEEILAFGGIYEDIKEYLLAVPGSIYDRPGLELKYKEMVSIASLLTQGASDELLKSHIQGGLNAGLTTKEIVEIFIQCIPYIGFPRVITATRASLSVLKNEE